MAQNSIDVSVAPKKSGLVLAALIIVAAVANLNLSVANVALPDIGDHFDASQTALNLVAIGYSLGLAASVLYLGAVGDRYGRKLLAVAGVLLAIPASILAATAPNENVLITARIFGGLSAGMAYPTTLALITALWAGPARTKAIALWSSIGGAIAALGPLTAGWMLDSFYWGSVFLITLPLAVVALILAIKFIPSHVNETTEKVDNLGGLLSIVLVGSMVLAINFAPVPNATTAVWTFVIVAVVAAAAFFYRQKSVANPLYDLHVAGRRVFWVAACAGIIVFGALMAAMFVGQQFMQNVLGYSTLEAGAAALPAAFCMVLVAPRSAKIVESHGARITLLIGYAFAFAGFAMMFTLWGQNSPYWQIAIAYMMLGIGVGFAGTPASHSLTGSVPVTRAGMASGTADLQRDLGGAVMQSILGALLTAGYASAVRSAIAGSPQSGEITNGVQSELTKSFASAAETAQSYPQYASQIIEGAKQSFLDGADWAYVAGMAAVAAGFALVFFMFPKHRQEQELLQRYHDEDSELTIDITDAATSGVAGRQGVTS